MVGRTYLRLIRGAQQSGGALAKDELDVETAHPRGVHLHELEQTVHELGEVLQQS